MLKEIVAKLDPRVKQLLKDLDIDLKVEKFNGVRSGMYITSMESEYIVLSHGSTVDPNFVLLHEITHWSGHPHRLARRPFVMALLEYSTPNKAQLQYEEAVAQWGMYYLAIALGLDRRAAWYDLVTYNSHYDPANIVGAEQDALKAAVYILDQQGVLSNAA